MNWKDISTSEDNTCFLFHGRKIFDKDFIEVLKFHDPGIAPVRDESGAYHIDSSGMAIYQSRYSRTFGYYYGRAAVVYDARWFHIDEKGCKVYNEAYTWVGNYQEKFCVVRSDLNRYFHVNLSGEPCYSVTFRYAGDFRDGIACVMLDDGMFIHINHDGMEINQKRFMDLGVFHKNYATAKDKTGWFHIDKMGNALYQQRYLSIEPFYNGYALCTTHAYKKVIVDERGFETNWI